MKLLFRDLVSAFVKLLSSDPWSFMLSNLLLPFSLGTRPSSSDTPVAMSTPDSQPLASNHPHEEEPGLFGSITGQGLGQQWY